MVVTTHHVYVFIGNEGIVLLGTTEMIFASSITSQVGEQVSVFPDNVHFYLQLVGWQELI